MEISDTCFSLALFAQTQYYLGNNVLKIYYSTDQICIHTRILYMYKWKNSPFESRVYYRHNGRREMCNLIRHLFICEINIFYVVFCLVTSRHCRRIGTLHNNSINWEILNIFVPRLICLSGIYAFIFKSCILLFLLV